MLKSNKLALAGIVVAVAAFSAMGCRSGNNPAPATFNSPSFSQQGSGTVASPPTAAGSGSRAVNPAYNSGFSSGGSGSR